MRSIYSAYSISSLSFIGFSSVIQLYPQPSHLLILIFFSPLNRF
nr:MAG TPA: hypothetical protein [Caudoviricetes sp.]